MSVQEALQQMKSRKLPAPSVSRKGTAPAPSALQVVRHRKDPVRQLDELWSDDGVELLAGERHANESTRAVLACNDFLRMGPSRSVAGLTRHYKRLREKGFAELAIIVSDGTFLNWSSDYSWSERADVYDAMAERDKNTHAREVMGSGLALAHERVAKLKRLAHRLEQEITGEGLWIDDIKQVGSGRFAETFTVRRFNSSLVEQYRGVLADLADETGGRQKLSRSLNINLDELTDEQLEQLAAGASLEDIMSGAPAVAETPELVATNEESAA